MSGTPTAPGEAAMAAALEGERRSPRWTARVGQRDATGLLRAVEGEVRARGEDVWQPASDGHLLVTRAGSWHAGRFSTPTIGELLAAASSGGAPGKPSRLSALVGAGPLADIGTLQAMLGPGVLFQAASQFNALEAPSPHRLVPVSRYPSDPTQGPRASVGAFPGTFMRHYRAPGGEGGFAQTESRQLNLLEEVTGPGLATVVGGYLLRAHVADGEALAWRLEDGFDQVRVGVQEGVEVVLGHGWGGPVPTPPIRIHQVFTSTMALGGYDARGQARERVSDELVERICRQLLRAAYLGTLLAASRCRATGVVLTLIGGGVFGNPRTWIREAILWALEAHHEVGAPGLEVWVNTREDGPGWPRGQLEEDVAARGGEVIEAHGPGLLG